MDIIKIKRDTIRKNEDRSISGNPTYIEGGGLHVSFECDGMPTWCDESAYRIDYVVDGRVHGELVDVSQRDQVIDFIEKGKASGQGFSGSMRWDPPIEIHSMIEAPEYLYDYDNESPVTCSNCGTTMPIKDVGTFEFVNQDGDDTEINVCPVCKAHSTFDYRTERISEALKKN